MELRVFTVEFCGEDRCIIQNNSRLVMAAALWFYTRVKISANVTAAGELYTCSGLLLRVHSSGGRAKERKGANGDVIGARAPRKVQSSSLRGVLSAHTIPRAAVYTSILSRGGGKARKESSSSSRATKKSC